MSVTVYDDRICELGEGPLWHPTRQQLFWFDIHGRRLLTREGAAPRHWQFQEHVSAAGWVDDDHLLIASETRLFLMNVESGQQEDVVPLDADNPITRSNDGRVDPWGGFWIGTMGKAAQAQAGAIYRYYRGELRMLFDRITVSNGICFSPDGRYAYFTDTPTQIVMRQELAPDDGWPLGRPDPWLDLRGEGWNPDGAVCDADGHFWTAQWEGWRVARYDPEGRFVQAIAMPAAQSSCPAFGGPDLNLLFCTSARVGLSQDDLAASSAHGQTFVTKVETCGQKEHKVVL